MVYRNDSNKKCDRYVVVSYWHMYNENKAKLYRETRHDAYTRTLAHEWEENTIDLSHHSIHLIM